MRTPISLRNGTADGREWFADAAGHPVTPSALVEQVNMLSQAMLAAHTLVETSSVCQQITQLAEANAELARRLADTHDDLRKMRQQRDDLLRAARAVAHVHGRAGNLLQWSDAVADLRALVLKAEQEGA